MRVQSASRAAAAKREQPPQPQAKPAAPAQTTPLPKSDYWTATPSPSRPSVMPATQKQVATTAGATPIIPPQGYTVTKVEPIMVPEKEELPPSTYWTATPTSEKPAVMGPTVNKAPMVEAVSYELTKKPEPVKLSDLSITEQEFIAVDTGLKLMKQKAGDHPIIKAEIDYGISPLVYGAIGAAGALESGVYGIAGLVGSVKKSVENKQLTYAPGFEGLVPSWKTPKLAPTPSGSFVSLFVGGGEAQEFSSRPWAYRMGSIFGEVGFDVVTGAALGFVGGKTSTFVKTVVNPRVNQAAESALARSSRLFEKAANKIQPGLGRATETVISRDVAALGTRLDLVEAKAGAALTSKIVNPAKYGIVNPVVDVAVKAKRGVATVGQRIADVSLGGEAGSVAKSVVVPNLKQPQKLLAPTVKLAAERSGVTKTAGYIDDLARDVSTAYKGSAVKQALMYEKSVGIPSAKNVLSNYATPLTKSNVGIKPVMSEAAAYAKVSAGKDLFKAEHALRSVNTQLRNVKLAPESGAKAALNQLSYQKAVLQTQMKASYDVLVKPNVEVGKALGKVASGTLRYRFSIPAPKQPVVKTPLKFSVPKVETKQVTVQVQKQEAARIKEVVFTSGMPKVTSPYPGTRQRFREEYELTPMSYPKEKLTASDTKLVPTITPNVILAPKITPDQRIKIVSTPKIKPFIDTHMIPSFKPKIDSKIVPVVTPKFATIQAQKPLQAVKLTPSFPRVLKGKAQFPSLGLGGGGGGRGGFDSLTGKWYKYKNPVKTPKQMLKDFSTFGSTKNTKKQSFGNFGFNTKAFKANPILSFNPAKGNKRQKSPFGNFAVNTRNNPILNFNLQNKRKTKVLKDFESFGGKSRVSISTPKFKQPRINYNLSKQRRKRKR